ncbi:MAG: Undecaprenyl-phosphate galactose phosphotransferase [Candidatus Saccharibacteria bacterium]|nr:Undecaprenyl-phosphate galactose phosphotransferase [Candidatus Saccharibacteria bacterium]
MKNNTSLIYGFFLIVGDFLALIGAFISAFILRVTLDNRPTIARITSAQYLKVFLLLLPFWLIIFGLLGLYNKNTYENRFSEFGRLIIGSFIGILFVISYGYITNTPIFPARLVTVYGFLLALCFMLLFRTLARVIRRGLFSYGYGVNHVLIVGNTIVTDELITSLENTEVTGYKVVGIVSTNTKHGSKHKQHIFESFEEAIKKLKNESVHSIIQTELYVMAGQNSEILTYAQENHIAYRFVPGNSELFVGNIEVDLFQSIPVIAVHQTALVGWGRIVKRIFDIFASLIFIIIASVPMLLIAFVIKITDPRGKIFYKPKRLGRFGNTFNCYKFRSMYQKYNMSPEEGFAKMGRLDLLKQYRENGDRLPRDPRITPIGRFIRKFSLDELPQLFNVLKGDISLVGPRALDHFELDQYAKKNLILSVKTGLTGLAQISGRSDIPFEERRKLDLYYVQNWSFWNDLVIVAKTVSVVLFHRGVR